jgi:hypothetical protein
MQDIPTVFPNHPELPNGLQNVIHVPISSPSTMNAMDVLQVDFPPAMPSVPGYPLDFSSQCENFSPAAPLVCEVQMEPSSNLSQVPETQLPLTTMHPIAPNFNASTSSLATALDAAVPPPNCNRSGSTASPIDVMTSLSSLVYPAVGSVLTPIEPPCVPFPPAIYPNGVNSTNEKDTGLTVEEPLVAVQNTLGR